MSPKPWLVTAHHGAWIACAEAVSRAPALIKAAIANKLRFIFNLMR
jgi:hypothetical protein